MSHRLIRRAAAASILVALAACSSSSDATAPANPFAAVAGNYSLTAFNGHALPTTYTSGGVTGTLTTALLTLHSDKTWSEAATVIVNGINAPITGSGTYDITGTNAISLTNNADNAVEYIGTYTSNSLILTGFGGSSFLYTR